MSGIPVANKKDIQIGLVSAAVGLLLIFIFLILMSFEVADPKPEPPKVDATSEIEDIVLENLKVDMGGGSEGAPSEDPKVDPQPQTQKTLTKKSNTKTKVPAGKSEKDTEKPGKGETSGSDTPSMFNGNGEGKKGAGAGKVGTKDSQGEGNGPGPNGYGNGTGRKRLTEPKVGQIHSNKNQTIYLRVVINSEGKVLSVKNLPAKTTTNDGVIINKIMAAVKKDVLFSKKPGSGQEQLVITINIKAS